ncbi:MAG: 2-C-methyl-D-erythritol 2,4-cyclodiphosphate synthase [Dehalococcoidia bacterium]|nr:2-C-methyl-D-erythritol 2,4-cyclodiphosphate synthase [Dehalococcoidia bacterium]
MSEKLNKNVTVIILAAGESKRFKEDKIFFDINGLSVAEKTLRTINLLEFVDSIVIVCSETNKPNFEDILGKFSFIDTRIDIVIGSETRAGSLINGLKFLKHKSIKSEFIIVQDIARPFTKESMYLEGIEELDTNDAVIFGLQPTDTVKIIDKNNFVLKNLDRRNLSNIQTPQFFKSKVLYKNVDLESKNVIDLANITDDSSFLDPSFFKIKVLKGDEKNIKITTKNDVDNLHSIFYGIGFDMHKLVPSESLRIGGIDIDYPYKLQGHSDGDVLIHSIIDSILGGCNLGDIGIYFPSENKSIKNIDSTKMLKDISVLCNKKGYEIIYIDNTIIAQKPKMSCHINEMKNKICNILNIQINHINIKSTTTDKLGIIGTEKAIAAQSITTIKKIK